MKIRNFIWRNIALGAVTLCFVAMGSGLAMAQEDAPSNMQKTQPVIKQDSWESWKQDVKAGYQQIRTQADKIKSDAQASNLNTPAFKDAVDKFEASAKTFSDKWSTVDQVMADKRDQFKADINGALDKVKSAFDNLKSQSNSAGK